MSKLFSTQLNHVLSEKCFGYDPFDGLNSPIIQKTFLNSSKWVKIAFLQFSKRSVINFRPLLGIRKHRNPKAVALTISAIVWTGNYTTYKNDVDEFVNWLIANRSGGYDQYCWGYPFDWQALAFFQPKNTPTVVCSSFVGQAFLDLYEVTKEKKYLDIAVSVADFMSVHLNRTAVGNGFCFSYSPEDTSVILNASALGARHLARCYSYTKNNKFKELSIKAIQPVLEYQSENGSWVYGLQSHHGWIDSFHTGYNLECLQECENYLGLSFGNVIEKGLNFYLDNLFLENGFPKNLSTTYYPVDSHSPSQLFVTIYKLNCYTNTKTKVDKVYDWWIKNLYSKKTRRFYFQRKNKWLLNKVDYMRWTQCWSLIGLAAYECFKKQKQSK